MRTVSYKLADLGRVVIHLGKMAENDATQVRIDAAEVFSEYPDAVPALDVINPTGEAYTVEVTLDGTVVVWNVKDSSLTAEGLGEIQLTFTQNGTKVKSSICRTQICRSISGGGTPPDPVQDWLDEANEVLAETTIALNTLENMTASAEGLPAGSNPTATYENGNIAFGIPKGDKGETGATGQDGVTPNLTVGTTTTGAAGTSASVTRRAGSPDSAPIFDFTIPKGDKGDHGDLQLDSTLTSASAAAPADQVGNLKSAFGDISESTYNLFDPSWILAANGWVKNGNEYYGTAQEIYNVYKSSASPIPFPTFKTNTQYAFSLKAKVSGSVTTNSCFRLVITYTDTTSDTLIAVGNDKTSYTSFSGISASGKTIQKVNVSYGNGLTNTLYLKEVQCEEGSTATEYIPVKTAMDQIARNTIKTLNGPTDGKAYIGEKISIASNRYSAQDLNISIGQGQSCVILGNYALGFSSDNGTCKVTDVTSGSTVTTFSMPTAGGETPHFNSVVWGDTVDGQTIPLLYANVNLAYSDYPGLCAVYQISVSGDTWSATLVQTINVSFVGDTDWGEITRYDVVDFAVYNGKLYAIGASSEKKRTNICSFNIPSHSADVTLTRTDIVDEFFVPYISITQGCMVDGGKLYMLSGLGLSNDDTADLYVIDLTRQMLVSYVDISEVFTGEPEFIFVYDGSIIFGGLKMIKLIT